MNADEVRAVLAAASELVRDIPEQLRPCAFSKAVEMLSDTDILIKPRKVAPAAKVPASMADSKTSKAVRRPSDGPKGYLRRVLAEGFFASSRSIAEMQQFLKDHKGRVFSSKELSISALRLVREGALERQPTDEGQYTYKARQD